ncbi:MAG: penicillin-binding protein activator [Ignavibacteriales bacterium]|nr:penicillin-binding protein activator [Ignavibacteriales bacterium]
MSNGKFTQRISDIVKKWFLKIFPIFLIAVPSVFAQEHFRVLDEANVKFEQGLHFFQSKKYEEALAKFHLVAKTLPTNQRSTAAAIMSAKSLYCLQRYSDAIQLLQTFLSEFPETSFKIDAHQLLAKCFYAKHRYLDALREYLFLYYESKLPKKNEYLRNIETISAQHLSLEVLTTLTNTSDIHSKPLLLFLLVKKNIASGNIEKAITLLDSVRKLNIGSDLEKKIKSFSIPAERLYRLGVLLPLTGSSSAIGNEVLDGIKFAHQKSQRNNDTLHLQLEIRDSKREQSHTSIAVQELASEQSTLAILGPLFSDETRAAARKANELQIPLLSPTAAAEDIEAMGRYVFQSTPTYTTDGVAMAHYAFERWKCKHVGILSSTEPHARTSAEAFATEMQRMGSHVLTKGFYPPSSTSLKEQCTAIIAMNRKFPLDVLYIALGSAEEMSIVTAQLKYYNIRTRLVGNREWNDTKALLRNQRTITEIIFCSDYSVEPYKQKQLAVHLKKEPSNFFIYGYDAFQVLYSAVGQFKTREEIALALRDIKKFSTLHTTVSFTEKQSNQYVQIMQLKEGIVKIIGEVNAYEK